MQRQNHGTFRKTTAKSDPVCDGVPCAVMLAVLIFTMPSPFGGPVILADFTTTASLSGYRPLEEATAMHATKYELLIPMSHRQ